MAMATPDATRPLTKLRFFIIFAPAQLTALLLREFRFLDALVNEYYSAKICQAPSDGIPSLAHIRSGMSPALTGRRDTCRQTLLFA